MKTSGIHFCYKRQLYLSHEQVRIHINTSHKTSTVQIVIACKAGGFAEEMIRKQRLRTTGRHFERANKGETGERKKEKGRGWGRGKRRQEGGGGGGGSGGGKNRLPGN